MSEKWTVEKAFESVFVDFGGGYAEIVVQNAGFDAEKTANRIARLPELEAENAELREALADEAAANAKLAEDYQVSIEENGELKKALNRITNRLGNIIKNGGDSAYDIGCMDTAYVAQRIIREETAALKGTEK